MKTNEKTPSKMRTNGVQTLLGEPKKAIIKLALPMIAAMLIQTIYNLADALWVSGLGADALAAVGFVFPLFILIMAIATGMAWDQVLRYQDVLVQMIKPAQIMLQHIH